MAKNLFDYVHEILAQRETLVVPDFGAFVLQKTTTFLNDSDYISIIFTAQQQNDDGVLKNYIVNKTKQTEEEVEEYISSELEKVFIEINSNSIYKVEGIGDFRAINDSIVFKPYDEQYLKGADAEDAEDAEGAESAKDAVAAKLSLEEAAAAFLEKEEKVEEVEILEEGVQEVQEVQEVEKVEKAEKVEKVEEVKNVVEEKKVKASATFDIKKYSTGIVIFIIIALLSCVLYCFRNEIANLNKSSITNDTTQVASQENMQQLSDTLTEINNSTANNESPESIDTSHSNINIEVPNTNNTIAIEPSNNNTSNKSVILKGNVSSISYFIAKSAYQSRQQALAEKQNLDVTGFVAKIIETTNARKYNVVVAEFNNESSAKEELNFYKKIDNQFYLMTVKPNDK